MSRLRVAVYGLRQSTSGWELLTFRHRGVPEAGLQLPAGGVERGETLESAACRELCEETGLVTSTVLGSVGWQDLPHPRTQDPRLTVFYAVVLDEPRRAWSHTVAGDDDVDSGLVFDCAFLGISDDVVLEDRQAEFLRAAVDMASRS